MLGAVRRTTRTDVGLALSFAGVTYLIWALVIGLARHLANELSKIAYLSGGASFSSVTSGLHKAFLHGGDLWDLLGILWLLASLVLIVGSSRQRWIISWPWLSAICHALASALVAGWAALAACSHVRFTKTFAPPEPYPTSGWTAFTVTLAVAPVLWAATLAWLLYERARLRRGPSLRDGQRTHVPG